MWTATVGLNFRSFRAKFILVVGAAILFDLTLASGIAIWNVQRLSKNATEQVADGLTSANQEYLQTYVATTALRANLLLERVHSEVTTLAKSMQALIDHPNAQAAIGAALDDSPAFSTPLQYNPQGNWSQNVEGAPSAVSVWGYLLGPDNRPIPQASQQVRDSAFLSLAGPAMMSTGAPKLQVYYVGPKSASIMRAVPYSEQAQTFDRLYPGHNSGPNFWDFFFPGVYEGWQGWLTNPATRPVPSDITTTAPYTDAITGELIVSYFHPLWTPNRTDVAGMVAADVTLEQLANVVESVKVAETGFGFLTMSSGNVIAVNQAGQKTLGLVASDVSGKGVTGLSRSLRSSTQPSIANLALPDNEDTQVLHLMLDESGEEVPYLVVMRHLEQTNLWNGSTIVPETMTLGFMVPEREIYASLYATQDEISAATKRILNWQLTAVVFSLLLVFAAVYAISGRITSGLSQLADAARRLQARDYSVRVNIPSRDEVGEVGIAFNRMVEEIRFNTENLERAVEDRTRELASANKEILGLNIRLRRENRRLGAELDIARQIQTMVLPKKAELAAIQPIEIAGYMEPAEEVGGDYYDVLQDGCRVKVGIGDVTGHGLESGVLMLMVQSVARALQEQREEDPKEFLSVLNRAIYKNVERTSSDKHLSLAFLDYENERITVSGQHEEVLFLPQGGTIERIDTMDLGFPVGLESDISPFVATHEISFSSGDIIVLHTDGVTEAESAGGELFGIGRLCESLERHRAGTAEEIKRGIVADLMAHIGTHKIHDDITLVVMRHR